MKEEWEVSILLALFLLFCGDNSPQRKGGHRVNYESDLKWLFIITLCPPFPL